MICLDNTDTLEGGASINAVVDYTVHGLVGSTFANIAQGQLSSTDPTVLYTAGAAISIVSVIFVNTHSAAVTVNLYLDPANAGTPRRLIPKNLSLEVGYSAHFDGAKLTILDASGRIATSLPQGLGTTDSPTFAAPIFTSFKASGGEQLKTWTYNHTITAAERAANLAQITVTAVTLAKVRSLSYAYFTGATIYGELSSFVFVTAFYLSSTTLCKVDLGTSATAGHIISITITEAV